MSPVVRDQPQRALAMANEVRLAMAARRRELDSLSSRESLLRAAEMLDDPDEIVARMKVKQLLTAIERVSTRRMHKLLGAAGVNGSSPERRIGPWPITNGEVRPLTPRQRGAIAHALRETARRGR